MVALPPDYDSDPDRSRSFRLGWQEDVHSPVAQRLADAGTRLVLDVGCGIGRFASAVEERVDWLGVDRSPRQLQNCAHRPVTLADAAALPLRDESVDAIVMLWMLYHLKDPTAALTEARRVLRPGGLLAACAASRWNDPELVPAGYPTTTFDAEEAAEIVAAVFGDPTVEVERWDEPMVHLADRDEVMAYARSHHIPAELAKAAEAPLHLTKAGCLIWARKA